MKDIKVLIAVRRIHGTIEKDVGEKPKLILFPHTNFVKVQYIFGIISLVGSLLLLATLAWLYPIYAIGDAMGTFDFYLPALPVFIPTVVLIGLGIVISIIGIRSRRAIVGLLLYLLSFAIVSATLLGIFLFMGTIISCWYGIFCCYYGGL